MIDATRTAAASPPRSVVAGQLDPEGRAVAVARVDADPPVHPADELAADVEAEAGAADTAVQMGFETVELLEDPLLLVRRDTVTAVRDLEAYCAASGEDAQRHGIAAVLESVFEQVDQNLSKLLGIAGCGSRTGFDIDADAGRIEIPRGGFGHPSGIDHSARDGYPAGVDLAREQNLFHERGETRRFGVDQLEEPLAHDRIDRSSAQCLRGAVDRRNRRP